MVSSQKNVFTEPFTSDTVPSIKENIFRDFKSFPFA